MKTDVAKVPGTRVIIPKSYNDEINIEEYVQIIEAELNREFRLQSTRYAIIATNHAKAKYFARQRKRDLELEMARLRDKRRQIGGPDAEKKNRLTKDTVDSYVVQQPGYQEALQRYNDALYREDLMRGFLDALEQKKDALVSYAANVRVEMQPELVALVQALKDKQKGLANGSSR